MAEPEEEKCIREVNNFVVSALVPGNGCKGVSVDAVVATLDAVLDVLPDSVEQPHKEHMNSEKKSKDKT
ncbi:hypothetical protein [Sporomusa malonica]|uniref:Uncharacterized protein n=2 Tax=Sporomusa malonica TaxID=112901 RepID=A0A1W1ZHN0_9FIRM|nr:hypothetical protein SAMN04488500_103319 [Sporomusa malonica]